MEMPCCSMIGASSASSRRASGTAMAARSGRSATAPTISVDRRYGSADSRHMHIDSLRNLVDLDRRALAATVEALKTWDPADGSRSTPCTEWTIADLVAHMTVQHRGFARAVRGERTVAADWVPPPKEEPIAAYRAACADVETAFAAIADPDAPVLLPEVREQ